MIAGGGTEKQADDRVMKLLAEKEVAADYREQRGLVRGFARMGDQKGGFRRFEEIEANTPADFEAQRKKRYEDSEAGNGSPDANQALADAKAGTRNLKIAELRQESETDLTNRRQFEQFPGVDRVLGNLPIPGTDDAHEQQVNRRAISKIRSRLHEPLTTTDVMASMNSGLTDELLRELIQKLEQRRPRRSRNRTWPKATSRRRSPHQGRVPGPAAPPALMPMAGGGRR